MIKNEKKSMKKISWAILGAARVNERLIPAIINSDQGELVAIGSRREKAAEECIKKYAKEYIKEIECHNGFDSILNRNVISLTFEEYQKLRKNTNAAVIIGCIIVVAVLVATWPGIGGSSGDICFDPRCD